MSSPLPPIADLPFLLMRAQAAVAERINDQIAAHGHPGLRPVHGVIFARIAAAGASVNEIAAHLGITKQSAATIIEALEADGYVSRRPHPTDRRARLVELTDRGRGVTELAARTAAAVAGEIERQIGRGAMATALDALHRMGEGTPPRPAW
ncbi:MarR family winged helix-turn-helix transcriptional regulator [Gordonia sp. DT219]|uniref:MarR family winged helix-turn-helix transcriptional regulator n=1 Tax=Gordonia sp. DT219 TaxID=3416658 RepID=UPI003CE9AD22